MSFDEVDELFYLLENPTRRRILQLLSIERLYPLQLSKEIDVTQQAVVKHLRIFCLIQLYSCLVFKGPGVTSSIVRGLKSRVKEYGFSGITEAVGNAHK